MLGPENELEANAAASVSRPLSTGVFQLEDLLGLAFTEPRLVVVETDGVADGFSDPEVGAGLAADSDEFGNALPAEGATVTNWVTAGCCGT